MLKKDFEQQSHEMNSMNREINSLIVKRDEQALNIKEMSVKLREYESNIKTLSRTNNQYLTDKTRLTAEKNEAQEQKTITVNGVNALQREIEHLRKQTETEKSNILGLIRDRDMMQKYIKKAENENANAKKQITAKDNEIASLREQGRAKQENIAELIKQTYRLEKDRDKFSLEASKANANLMQMVEEVKLKTNMITELKKEVVEFEGKLKQQQTLYEAVRSDRNLYNKNLIEANDEVAQLRRNFKQASLQIYQLKEDIDNKDQAVTQITFDKAAVQKQLEEKKSALKAEEKKYEKLAVNKAQLDNEIERLSHIIRESYLEIEKLKKDFNNCINERDILGTQLIRRNDELALLYEKIKILQSKLGRGEVQYQQRLEDIKILTFKIGDLKSELRILKSQASQIPDLRKEVYNLQNMVVEERLQVKALAEELENPINKHRWRKLQGTDPDTWEMLQKIQTLQKRLIKKTEEVVEKDVIIQEKEKLYVELKNLLARQPGPEVAEQLSIYQQNLKEKTSQMKAMAAELNMYQAQVNEYKYEIERLTRELQDMKRKYYEQKRREQMQREAQQRLEPRLIN